LKYLVAIKETDAVIDKGAGPVGFVSRFSNSNAIWKSKRIIRDSLAPTPATSALSYATRAIYDIPAVARFCFSEAGN
jgi:hypothetical protein